VGGSNADRLLNCPASYQATIALPPSVDAASEYAEEGTAMHHVMDALGRERMANPEVIGINAYRHAGRMLGKPFHDRTLTQEHLDTMIFPAIDALDDLEKHYGRGFKVLGVELSVNFPGIPGAHGTCDIILGSPTHIIHADYKFGQGVPVKAVYTDDLGERLNPQLMFYTIGSMHSFPKFYQGKKKKKIVAAIIQPRTDEPLTHTVVTPEDLAWFTEDLNNAVIKALDRNPPRVKGEHCRFAPCKIDCPLWTGPLLDLSALGKPPSEAPAKTVTPYADYLAKAKMLVDLLAMYKKEVDEQLHSYLESGGYVEGWRLKPKVKMRQWIDENIVEKELKKLGFKPDEIWQKKLTTFQSADATAKRRGVVIPERLRVAPPTNETTIATTDDPAPVVERLLLVENFRASLKQLLKQQS
jgi:hypothetical protein